MKNQAVGGSRMGWRRLVDSDDGAGMAEYALLLLLVALAAASIFTSLAGFIQDAVSIWVSRFNGIN